MYAKFIDRANLEYFKNPIRQEGYDIFTNDPTKFGFKTVVIPTAPVQEGYHAVFDGWEETETEIRQLWKLEPNPEPTPTLEDRVTDLEGGMDGLVGEA